MRDDDSRGSSEYSKERHHINHHRVCNESRFKANIDQDDEDFEDEIEPKK